MAETDVNKALITVLDRKLSRMKGRATYKTAALEDMGLFKNFQCFEEEAATLISQVAARRGEVHLGYDVIEGIVFPVILETGQLITGVRSASLNSSYNEVTTMDMNVILHKFKTEEAEDGDSENLPS